MTLFGKLFALVNCALLWGLVFGSAAPAAETARDRHPNHCLFKLIDIIEAADDVQWFVSPAILAQVSNANALAFMQGQDWEQRPFSRLSAAEELRQFGFRDGPMFVAECDFSDIAQGDDVCLLLYWVQKEEDVAELGTSLVAVDSFVVDGCQIA